MGQLLLNPVRAAVGQSDQDSAVDRWRYPWVGGCAARRAAFVRGDTHRHGEGRAVVLQRGAGPGGEVAAGESVSMADVVAGGSLSSARVESKPSFFSCALAPN